MRYCKFLLCTLNVVCGEKFIYNLKGIQLVNNTFLKYFLEKSFKSNGVTFFCQILKIVIKQEQSYNFVRRF